MEFFGMVVALFGLAMFLIVAAIPLYITFVVVRWIIGQIKKTAQTITKK